MPGTPMAFWRSLAFTPPALPRVCRPKSLWVHHAFRTNFGVTRNTDDRGNQCSQPSLSAIPSLPRVATSLSLRTRTFPAVVDQGDSSLLSCFSSSRELPRGWRQEGSVLGRSSCSGARGMGLDPSSGTCEWGGLRQIF